MSGIQETLWLLVLVALIMLAASSRLLRCIHNVAFQGLLVGIIPLAVHGFAGIPASHLGLSAINIAVKCVALPALMAWTVKRIGIKRELEPLLGYSRSICVTLIFIAFSFFLSTRLPLPADAPVLALPAAFSAMLTGLFIIMARRKAITQVIGFLTFENGITLFAAAFSINYGAIVELGVLLDVFVLIFIMVVLVFSISSEYKHIDSDKLNMLGDDESRQAAGGEAK